MCNPYKKKRDFTFLKRIHTKPLKLSAYFILETFQFGPESVQQPHMAGDYCIGQCSSRQYIIT